MCEVERAVVGWRKVGRAIGMTDRELEQFADAFEYPGAHRVDGRLVVCRQRGHLCGCGDGRLVGTGKDQLAVVIFKGVRDLRPIGAHLRIDRRIHRVGDIVFQPCATPNQQENGTLEYADQ